MDTAPRHSDTRGEQEETRHQEMKEHEKSKWKGSKETTAQFVILLSALVTILCSPAMV